MMQEKETPEYEKNNDYVPIMIPFLLIEIIAVNQLV